MPVHLLFIKMHHFHAKIYDANLSLYLLVNFLH